MSYGSYQSNLTACYGQSGPTQSAQAPMGGPQQAPPTGMLLPAFWQGQWIPQAYPGTRQGVPQWRQPAHIPTGPHQQQPVQAIPEATAQPSVEELVSAVVARLDKNKDGIVPSASNNKLITDALRKGKLKGQTPREAIEKLGDVCARLLHSRSRNACSSRFTCRQRGIQMLVSTLLTTCVSFC